MDFDIVIIGAGVVGLANARKFTIEGRSVLVVEKEGRAGAGISSRNSEVVHAGIYYPRGSLKSTLCLAGKKKLYDFCEKYNINFNNCGKYIVASDEIEIEKLYSIKDNAQEAGLEEIYLVSSSEVKKKEPAVQCLAALHSPTSGIVSAHELMDALKAQSEEGGAAFLFNSNVLSVRKNSANDGYFIEIKDSTGEANEVETQSVLNCSGLNADETSKILQTYEEGYEQVFVKGDYFSLSHSLKIFSTLIYPTPLKKLKGLGIHATIGLDGRVKFGPDAEILPDKKEFYSVDESKSEIFSRSIAKYYPEIKKEELIPDMAGIRPRLAAQNNFNDFIINEESKKGFPNIVNCVGIESPGLTASLAIADYIYDKIIL